MKIVLIEDDPDTHEIVVPVLEGQGFRMWPAYTGLDGLDMVIKVDPDLVLLDVYLPDMKGWEVCQRIRAVSDVPIIMISAEATADTDLVHALEIGADDYVVKPLRVHVFLARINALVRRSTRTGWAETHQAYFDNRLTIDLYREQLLVKGASVRLSFLEFRLLDLLVRNMNQTVPNSEIVEELWPGAGDVQNSIRDHYQYVRVYIRRLREALEPDPRHPVYIVNDRGLGYRFKSQ